MEREKSKITTLITYSKSTVKSKAKIEHQQAFNNNVRGNVFFQVDIRLPALFDLAEIEFRSSNEVTTLA